MKRIPLRRRDGTVNAWALVNDEDYDWINRWKWNLAKRGKTYYASRIKKYLGKTFLMHRVILKARKGKEVDHINMNGLDNRRKNLRVCSSSNNKWNRPKQSNNTSGFKGVSWHSDGNCWVAQIGHKKKHHYLGHYKSKIDAAKAYDKAAKKFFGEFAKLNFPRS